MGLFLQTAIIKNRGTMPVKKYLRELASYQNFHLIPEECTIQSGAGGTVVLFNGECAGYDQLAAELSVQAGEAVLLCYIYDDDFWGYYLYDDGREVDCFLPVPDYFGDVDQEEVAYYKGNAQLLSRYFGVLQERLEQYLCFWPEEGLPGKAYEKDQFGYEPWQVSDFMAALGFPMPEEEGLNDAGAGLVTAEVRDAALDYTPSAEGQGESFHFQVNLGGMLDVLSNHLYKSPDVFLRELLQNGVDAITLRQKEQPDWEEGRITISLEEGRRLVFRDNGAGLNEEEIHRFLAVIGQSSKTQLVDGKMPEDYIGRFGIGLLSCFMVADSIVVQTQPADGEQAHVWTGLPDGTYTLEPLAKGAPGTAIILDAKPGAEQYFQPERVAELVRYYGLALPVPVYLSGYPEQLNYVPADFTSVNRSRLLTFGSWIFEEEFLDAIPIQTPHLSGVAYVLPYRTDASVKAGHRIYLKNMLLTERGDTLLPSWAFFMRCFLNTNNLRPTASREDFYEDAELAAARDEFADAVRSYLENLALDNPEHLQMIVNTHVQAIKSMAVWDDELFRLFIDYLPFETSEGNMTGAVLKKTEEAVWVGDVPKFKQLKPVFMAQGRLLICAGYANDEDLLVKLTRMYGASITRLQEESMDLVLEEASVMDHRRAAHLIQAADRGLEEFDCQAEIRRFLPVDLPVLYSMSGEVQFLRQLQTASETKSGIFSGALTSLFESVEKRPLATLYLNLNNPLIQRLTQTSDRVLLVSAARVLYVQALLAGGHPLRGGELKTMNQELLNLIERSTQ